MKKVTLSSRWGEEKRVLLVLEQMFQPFPFLLEDVEDLKTAVAEACLNAMEHGNGLIESIPIHVHIGMKDPWVTVDVRDGGQGFQEHRSDHLQHEGERGWGLLFIDRLVDEWEAYHVEDPPAFGIRMAKRMRSDKGEGWIGTGTDDYQ